MSQLDLHYPPSEKVRAACKRQHREEEMKAGERDLLLGQCQQTDSQPEEPGEEVYLLTRELFQEYTLRARQRKSMKSERRNVLICNLHWRYRVDVHELESMFRLSKCTLKTIVKQRLSSFRADSQ